MDNSITSIEREWQVFAILCLQTICYGLNRIQHDDVSAQLLHSWGVAQFVGETGPELRCQDLFHCRAEVQVNKIGRDTLAIKSFAFVENDDNRL